MSKEKTKFGVIEAARHVGMHRNTLLKHINAKRLSFELDANGNKQIDAAELARVYPDKFKLKLEEGTSTSVKSGNDREVDVLRRQLDDEIQASRDQLKKNLEAANRQIVSLEEALSAALNSDNKAFKLIEDQSRELTDQSQANLQMIEDLRTDIRRLRVREKRIHQKYRSQLKKLKAALDERSKWQWKIPFKSS